jgi:prophage antirepressor-like protein
VNLGPIELRCLQTDSTDEMQHSSDQDMQKQVATMVTSTKMDLQPNLIVTNTSEKCDSPFSSDERRPGHSEGLVVNQAAIDSLGHIPQKLKSFIECGETDGAIGRVFEKFHPFFNKEVEFFYAVSDPHRKPLFRPHDVAKKLGIHASRVGMYLLRRRLDFEGDLYQALGFKHKCTSRYGLKVGAYFISEKVCKVVERWNKKKNFESFCDELEEDYSFINSKEAASTAVLDDGNSLNASENNDNPYLPQICSLQIPPLTVRNIYQLESSVEIGYRSRSDVMSPSNHRYVVRTRYGDLDLIEAEAKFQRWMTYMQASGCPIELMKVPDPSDTWNHRGQATPNSHILAQRNVQELNHYPNAISQRPTFSRKY